MPEIPTAERVLTISRVEARRLAISRQHLAAVRPRADDEGLRTVLRALRYLQLDPISVVAPSHDLVVWSRLGPTAGAGLRRLWWEDRWLFEYWAHAAAIVLTEDYPLHRATMDAHPPANFTAIKAWVEANGRLLGHVLERLGEGVALPTDAFDDCADVSWESTGWTAGRNVERMLAHLWRQGRIMVAGRAGGKRLWGLPEACLPTGTDRVAMSPVEKVTAATEHTLRALGAARPLDIRQYFLRGDYVGLPAILRSLTEQGRVVPVRVDGTAAKETWYVHAEALAGLDAIRAGEWEGRTALLSPFDNLINDRRLTERLWGFAFRNEMYVPKAQREYGYYLMPVLHGDRLVGRLAPRHDRKRGVLVIEGLFLEPDVEATAALRRAVSAEIADLAALTGASAIEYGVVPDRWRTALVRD
ncbi:crosslink repair DNA glycosylase YcaQ family protein [Phytomonospora sp. NPDC050363]|uniref:winged helix-turn-helix domain-containing protein n=1 Tax=Phytomonospora sp. NPDC050363 TaxID=3155642 RepID=UPI0033CF3428